MSALATLILKQVSSPPLAPAERAIDIDHLERMTMGDMELQREVLSLFNRQTGMLIARMQGATPAVISASAHTLKGSARGIGAFAMALAAEAVEQAGSEEELKSSQARLDVAVEATKAMIADLLRAH